jgi:outer membrane protein assembly factor BamB
LLIKYRVYFVATNYANLTWTLVNGVEIQNGAFGAVDQKTGKILWQTAIPGLMISSVSPTIVGDVMFAGSGGSSLGDAPGSLIAMNKDTGVILMNVELDVVFHGGISFANEFMLVSTGYRFPK